MRASFHYEVPVKGAGVVIAEPLRHHYLRIFVLVVLSACTGEFPIDGATLRAAEEAYEPALLRSSLEYIEAWHTENKTGLEDMLGPGIAVASIAKQFEGTDCRPTEEMKALWSWRDGESSPVPFVWYHDLLAVEQGLSEYKTLLLNPLVRWDPDYFPILTFEGEWYAAYCGDDSGTSGPLLHFFLEDQPRITYINITTFFASMAEALRVGAVRWENGAMVEDIGEVHRIHQKHNPGYVFPYHLPDR